MTLVRLALRNLSASATRTSFTILSVTIMAGLLAAFALLSHGAQTSLARVGQRLGADVVVVPEGTATEVETALLMGKPVDVWMPAANTRRIAQVAGVAQASPQLYLASLANASCCTMELFLVAFDPASDFTITPWLAEQNGGRLNQEEVVGGSAVFVPYGESDIRLYGTHVDLVDNLEPTGTGLDQTIFLTFDTAHEIARQSWTRAERPLEIPPDSVSAVMVRIDPDLDPRIMAMKIMDQVPGVAALPSPELFHGFRAQIRGLLRTMGLLLSITGVLSLSLTGLIFSLAAHERRREIGVLRALGANQVTVVRLLLTEAALLALAGAGVGIAVSTVAMYLFRNLIITSSGLTFLFPPWPALLLLAVGGLALATLVVALAALLPILRAGRLDPAVAMRA
jgi:putative ABC transport system permease protein